MTTTAERQRREYEERRLREAQAATRTEESRRDAAQKLQRVRDDQAAASQQNAAEDLKQNRDVFDQAGAWFERAATRATTKKLTSLAADPALSTILDAATDTLKKRADDEFEKRFGAPIGGLFGPA